jgi:hypothetical protein
MKYFPLLIIVLVMCFSCDAGDISSLTAEELEKIISENSYAELSEDAVSQLEPDSAFYLAVKAVSLGYEKPALLLSRHSWKNGSRFIREKAAELYIRTAGGMNSWADAEFAGSLAAAEFPDNYYFRRMAVAAAYWQQKDSGLFGKIAHLRSYPESDEDWELYLFCAVSAFRTESPGWEDSWILMFENVPASDFIRRGWDYLSASLDEPYQLFPGFEELIEGKYLASSGEVGEALELLISYLESSVGESGGHTGRAAALELEKMFVRQGSNVKGGKFFEEIAAASESETDVESYLFAAARLYRKAGWYGNAERCLDQIVKSSGSDISDRILWYALDVAARRNPLKAVERLDFYISLWDDPAYFADALDNLCTGLVRQRRWKEIASAAELLNNSGPAEISDRYSYITARAAEEGLIPGEYEKHEYTDLYYRIMDGDKLLEFTGVTLAIAGPPPEDEMNQAEVYINGLIRWGLDDHLLDAVREYGASLSEPFLIFCASVTAERLKHLDSIRMMYQYHGRMSREGKMSLYPALYREEVEYAAALNDIPPQLLFGLVWKESGFEREIISRSGAVGLSQLMPSTAEDVAGRMKIKMPDLTDPEENLLIGSWYLNWLTGYVGNNSAAVISYNGGPGRVRRWMREYSDLSPDLLYEAVPVLETHQYGKRVLTASVFYGMLYYNIDPAETVAIFFPN